MKVLLVIYDNVSYISWFPQGLAYIAAALRDKHDIVIYNQDMHHYPNEHLTEYLNKNHFDVLGVSVTGGYYQYRKLLKISEAVNKSKNRPFYVIGGHGPSPDPTYFIKKTGADAIVIGEGELTVTELLNCLENKTLLSNVAGIAYKDGDSVIINEKRKLIKDIDSIKFPAYDLFPIEYYRLIREPNTVNTNFVIPILSGRGCPFTCNFCYRLDKGFRPRSNDSIIEEINLLKTNHGINYIDFNDDLLMSSPKRIISICEDIIKHNLNIKWSCNGRLNYVTKEIIDIMKRAGCVFINYGIESVDDGALKRMNKHLTVEQIISGVEATLDGGISPGLNIIFGNIGETKEILKKDVEFLLKYDDFAQMRTIRPVTPYPGSPLYYYAIEKGLLKDCEDFYENKHTNSDLMSVNFTNMSDDEFYKELYNANKILLNNYNKNKTRQTEDTLYNLYIKRDANFRGFRTT